MEVGLVKWEAGWPARASIPAIIEDVVPLPFEPVTWTVVRPRWGSFRRERSERIDATLIAGFADFCTPRSLSVKESR